MKRFFITLFVIFSFLFIFTAGFPKAKAFVDVQTNHIFHEEILGLYDRGIVNGYSDFSFHPNDYVPRVEALSMILKARGDDVRQINYSTFSDVYSNDWYYKLVNYAINQKIVNGHPNGTFTPRKNVNFAEGLKMVFSTFFPEANQYAFRDDPLLYIRSHDWYASYFSNAKDKNIINKNKFYYPDDFMTRGELASVIHRIILIREGKADSIARFDNKTNNDYVLYIPKLGIVRMPVVYVPNYKDQNQLVSALINGLGNIRYKPGMEGKVVIYGHSSWYSGRYHPYAKILRQINTLEHGDRIYINYQNHGYVYEVFNERIVPPNHVEVLQSYGYEELALFTCWPPDTIRYRYVVHAKKIAGV